VLEHLERKLGRGEEDALAALAEPERPADAAGDAEERRLAFVEPRRRHRALEQLQRRRVAVRVGGDGEDRLRVDGHPRLDARAVVAGEELVVVDDDAVVDAHDRPVPDGVVVRGDRRVALRVVADVDEELRGAGRDVDPVEQHRGRRALLHDGRVAGRGRAVGVADGVGSALGDAREERLRCQGARGARTRDEAVAGDSAHLRR
jgi:hypothetical protein